MTRRKLWTSSIAGFAASMLLAANPALAHYPDHGRMEHIHGHIWHYPYYAQRPAVIVAPRPVYPVYLPPPVVGYAYPPAPVYYRAPAVLGTLGGAVAGAALGSTMGQGNGRTAAIAVGSALGAVIGSQAVQWR